MVQLKVLHVPYRSLQIFIFLITTPRLRGENKKLNFNVYWEDE